MANIASAAFSRRVEILGIIEGPGERGGAVDVRLAKVGHDIAGIELVGFLGRLEVRPVVRRLQEAAKLGAEGTDKATGTAKPPAAHRAGSEGRSPIKTFPADS